LDGKLLFDSIGEKKFRSVPKNKEENLFRNAWIIWEEYRAERKTIESFEAIKSDKIEFDYTPKLAHFETLKEFLSNLLNFLQENIIKFRLYQLTPEEICRLISIRVVGILILYSYIFALSDVVAKYKEKFVELNHLDGYKFFSEGLSDIRPVLLELYGKREKYNPELIKKIGNSIDSILMKCGLEIKDAPGGYYIEVDDIS